MSITSEIQRIKTNIANAYTELENKGATLPEVRNSDNLSAVIIEVPTGGGDEELIESFKSSCDGTLGSKCTKLPDGITKIGAHAFRYCTNLALKELPNTVTEIANMSFASATGLQLSKLPDSLVKIDNQAFQGCSNLAFSTFPNSVTSIGEAAFSGCTKLAITQLADGIKVINKQTFQNCTNLALTKLPDALTTLGASAFAGCNNIKIKEIPSGVTKIPDTCFQNCSSITELTILGNVTSIGYESISRCTSLSKVIFPNITSVPSSSSNTWLFGSPIANGSGYIYIPDELVETAKTKTNWTQYASQIKGLSELPTE